MPTKKTKAGREYEINGKRLTWHPLDDDDEPGNLADVTIPLRIKLGVVYDMNDRELDAAGMADMLDSLIPNQREALREMDLLDFEEMFRTWQTEYQALSGASLGESSP